MTNFKISTSKNSTLNNIVITQLQELSSCLDELVKLYLDAYQEMKEYAYSKAKDARYYLRWLFKRASGGFFIAKADDELVGFIVADAYWIDNGNPVGEIHEVVVKRNNAGKGIGKALIKRALSHFKNKGLARVGLWVGEKNQRAIRLYQFFGFEEKAKMGRWIRMYKTLK